MKSGVGGGAEACLDFTTVYRFAYTNPVGAAEGCDLLILLLHKQKIAAFGSSYIRAVREQ